MLSPLLQYWSGVCWWEKRRASSEWEIDYNMRHPANFHSVQLQRILGYISWNMKLVGSSYDSNFKWWWCWTLRWSMRRRRVDVIWRAKRQWNEDLLQLETSRAFEQFPFVHLISYFVGCYKVKLLKTNYLQTKNQDVLASKKYSALIEIFKSEELKLFEYCKLQKFHETHLVTSLNVFISHPEDWRSTKNHEIL